MSCDLAQLDAAYVLGALSPTERATYAAHLPGCAACTRAVRDLAGVPGLLAQVDPADLDEHLGPQGPPPPTLLPRLVREVRTSQRRRTWRTAAAAAAAALVVGSGAAWALGIARDDGTSAALPAQTSSTSSTAPAALAMTPVDQSVVTATLATVPVAWGTRLDLTCTWAAVADLPSQTSGTGGRGGYPGSSGEADTTLPAYALVVRTADGRTEQVATWRALPGRTMHLSGATATPAAQITGVEVRTASGQVVLVAGA